MTATGGLVGAAPAHAAQVTTVSCPAQNLQTAIDNAAPGSTLQVSGTCTGNFTITKNLTLIGVGGAVLDGNHTNTTVVVNQGIQAQLTNLAITNGVAAHGGEFNDDGGGIFSDFGSTLVLNHCTVSGNTNSTSGVGSGIASFGSATLIGSTVSGNTGNEAITGSSSTTLTNSTVSGNVGGGILSSGQDANLTVNHSTVSGNSSQSGSGGITNQAGGTVTLNHSTVTHNVVTLGVGGGIWNQQGTMMLISSAVSDNTAGAGGGMFISAGTVTLNHSTVSGNTAHEDGGGIWNQHGTVRLIGSQVINNSPDNCFPPGSVPGCTG